MTLNRIVFHYSRENRYSVNALAGALETGGPPGLRAAFPATAADTLAELSPDGGAGAAAALSFFTCQKTGAASLVKRLRKSAPAAVLIAGGPHPSAVPDETLDMGFDYVVAGEGERTFPRLLSALAAGEPPPRGVLRGLPADLSACPPFSSRWGLFGAIEITRGCPYACAYCQTSFLFGAKPRHRPVPAILRAMETMFARGLKDVRFITPDAFAYGSADGKAMNTGALRELLESAGELASARGGRVFAGSFPSEVRPDHVTHEALELVRKHASNRRLVIGAQAASPRLLREIRRGHGPGEVLEAARLCREHRLTPYFDFIFGLPGETRGDEDAAMELIQALVATGAIIHTHAFMPLPGTPFAGAPGGRISRRMRDFIEKLESRGKAFGKWRTQSRLGGAGLDRYQ